MLLLKNITKKFDNLLVLQNVDLKVKKGQFVSILGPSGTGKTVLLQLIAGFLKPDFGNIAVNGKTIDKPNPERYMIFQDYALFPWKTVLQNILFGTEKVNASKDEKKQIAHKCMNLVNLAKFQNYYPHQLSGGMRQRVAVARGLAAEPKLLLMDEPFSALDSNQREYLRIELEKIWKATGKTILFVTHDIEEAIYLSDQVHILSGRPAKIKKVFNIDLPRPRKIDSKEFFSLKREIKKLTSESNNLINETEKDEQKNLVW